MRVPPADIAIRALAGEAFAVVAAGDDHVLVDRWRRLKRYRRVRQIAEDTVLQIDAAFLAEGRREFAGGDVDRDQRAADARIHSRVRLPVTGPIRQAAFRDYARRLVLPNDFSG